MLPADLVRLFLRHRKAANLLMLLALIAGAMALARLNTQVFPTFASYIVRIDVEWPGATAEDIEAGILQVIEPEVRFLDRVGTVTATARDGLASIVIEHVDGTDMQTALADVEQAVGRITTLPEDSEEPAVSREILYETLLRLAVSGPVPEARLREVAQQVRDDLLARGIDRILLFGVRDEEIGIELDEAALRRLDLTLEEVAVRVGDVSRDAPLGRLEGAIERQLRSLGLRRDAAGHADIELRALPGGETVLLGDVADLSDRFDRFQPVGRRNGDPAVELVVQRAATADALATSTVIRDYLAEREGAWPAGVSVEPFDVVADAIRQRIDLLIENGLSGLVLVALVLFTFLNARLAFWIAAGIPTALAATAALMLVTGQSINMVSLFAMIMALGIIVDDAIMVGEHAAHCHALGMAPERAAETGALRMLGPVAAASLTTAAAFLPMLLVRDLIGQIIAAIPLVVVTAVAASLVECFLVLPTHVRHALARQRGREGRLRRAFDEAFVRVRDGPFRRMVGVCVAWRYLTLAAAVAAFILSIGLVAGGRVGFVFFDSPEAETVLANIAFAPGTPRARTEAMLAELERALAAVEDDLTGGRGDLVAMTFLRVAAAEDRTGTTPRGDHAGAIHVQLAPSDRRGVRTGALIAAWRAEVRPLPGLEQLTIRGRTGGPPGRDIDIRLSGGSLDALKAAALETQALLDRYPGVSDIEDDLPYGQPQLLLTLTPRGQALGFTTEDVAGAVRSAFEGAIAHRFPRGNGEVTVRVMLGRGERTTAGLRNLPLRTAQGEIVPLEDVASIDEALGFTEIRREDGVRQVAVTAVVDSAVTEPDAVLAALPGDGLAAIAAEHDVRFRFAGRAEERSETFGDMGVGAVLGLAGIYIVLAAASASYTRPLVVMAIIPFGLIGAVIGHLALGYVLSILSLIALLGLAGILVNDSIVLVGAVDERIARGTTPAAAIVDGACARFRAVCLTSLTTIGGLTPLLFETSYQARFLIPMAITLVFGLGLATVLVLIVVPTLLAVQEDVRRLVRLPRVSGAH